MRPIAFLLLASASFAAVDVQVAHPGEMGRSRIVELLEPPDHLARMDREERAAWLERACFQVTSTAQSIGYLDAACLATVAKSDSVSDRSEVRVDYDQGKLYQVGKVDVVFLDSVGQQPPGIPSLGLRPGQRFEQEPVLFALQEVQQYYRRRGWLDASVMQNLSVVRDSHQVHLRLEVTLGRVAVFSGMEVRFFGRHLTSSQRITSLFGPRKGDTIRNQDLAWFQRKLGQTRLFNQVKVSRVPARADTSLTDLRVDLTERVPGSMETSLSWEPKFGWGIGTGIRHQNVFGSFDALAFDARMAQEQQRARIGSGTPLFFGTPISFDAGIGIERQTAELADSTLNREITLSTDVTFAFSPTDWSTLSLGLETDREVKYPIESGKRVEYMFHTQLGGAVDFRDEPFDPLDGWILRSMVGWGVQFGYDTAYVWTQHEARLYLPLFWRFSTAYAVEGGFFFNNTTLDGSTVLWTGGPGTVRSYGYQELRFTPPPGFGLRPRLLRSSGELRLSLPWSTQMVGFVDAARLWNEGDRPDFLDLQTAKLGYGIGVRKRISLLSVRLDFCFGRGSERFAFDLAQAI